MSETSIPSVRLDNSEVWEAVLPRLREVVLSGRFTLGPELEEFESLAARQFGAGWCVGTSSGTSALTLALRASGLKKGARVALPTNTFFATFEAVVHAGYVPVLVDHDEHYLIDLDQLEALDVSAVIPVHLYGLPVDMPALMELARDKGWFVLEDGSQAHGATINGQPVGSFGDAAAFSCYPTKNLGAWGDAGFVCGNDPDIESRLRALRHHGQTDSNAHETVGGTERLDNIQALVLSEKLTRIDKEIAQRRHVAHQYRSRLQDVLDACPSDVGDRRHAYHQFVIEVSDRDQVLAALGSAEIAAGIHYPTPIHLQPASQGLGEVVGPLTRARTSSDRILSLPIFPGITDSELDRIVHVIELVLISRAQAPQPAE